MACVAALFASPALFPFPSTTLSTASASCSCRLRLRPAVVARAPRQQPRGRRALRRFDEVEGVSKKRRGIGGGGSGGAGGSQPSSSRRDRGLAVDFKESQVADFDDLEEDKFLNAVVKVYCTHIAPDYGLPWQKQRQHSSSGSAFMIGDGKLLTNAHCVEHDTQVKVKRRGDDKKYIAKLVDFQLDSFHSASPQGSMPSEDFPTFFALVCWELWKARNTFVFRQQHTSLSQLLVVCISSLELWRFRLPPSKRVRIDAWTAHLQSAREGIG